MGFQHDTDIAADVPDFFSRLETLLVAAGWTLVSGGGTTTIVYSSTGEVGTLTKLFIRIWRDGPNPERVYYRVQDDGGGTHFTTTANVGYLIAPLAGALPFVYWITATKDMVIITFKAGGYTGCYVGITEPFAATVPDETYQMVSVGLHTTWDGWPTYRPDARVLHRYDDTWDYRCCVDECTHEYNPNDYDSSHPIFGAYVYNRYDRRENYGQLRFCSGRIMGGTGINAEDTITSGYPGATSEWTAFGAGGQRWAVASSEPLPAGVPDGPNWGYTKGVAADVGALQAALEAFLTAKGWVIADWPSPAHPIDRSFSSAGESGGETIVLRWTLRAGIYWGGAAYDAIGGTHWTTTATPGNDYISGGDFPVPYWFSGDKDCFVVIVRLSWIMEWAWFGLCKSFFADPAVIPTEYMVGAINDTIRYTLRGPNGAWASSLNEFQEPGYTNSSPNLIDGKTFVIFPYTLYAFGAANYVPWGTTQYFVRMSSTSLSTGHFIQAGGHVFLYIDNNWAIKIA